MTLAKEVAKGVLIAVGTAALLALASHLKPETIATILGLASGKELADLKEGLNETETRVGDLEKRPIPGVGRATVATPTFGFDTADGNPIAQARVLAGNDALLIVTGTSYGSRSADGGQIYLATQVFVDSDLCGEDHVPWSSSSPLVQTAAATCIKRVTGPTATHTIEVRPKSDNLQSVTTKLRYALVEWR